MSDIAVINRFVVDGDDAERIYEIFRNSHFVLNACNKIPYTDYGLKIEFTYEDGVFRVQEKSALMTSYVGDILYFFVDRDHIFCLSEHIQDGVVQSYTVEDPEGKYFVRPPMTEWELQQEEKLNQRRNGLTDDLPF